MPQFPQEDIRILSPCVPCRQMTLNPTDLKSPSYNMEDLKNPAANHANNPHSEVSAMPAPQRQFWYLP